MILNLHGLHGSPHNTNYKLLLKSYSEDTIFSPQIDYIKTSPIKILDNLKTYKNIYYIVGNSFGGFFAYILTNSYQIPCLLVNPCIPPERYIPFLVEDYEFVNELAFLMFEYADNVQSVYMILGMEDNVLTPAYTERIIKAVKVWKIHGGHSLSGNELFYQVFHSGIKEIESIIGTGKRKNV